MVEDIITKIESLPPDFHVSGTLTNRVLRAIAEHCGESLSSSLETGCGRSTLLFSHISRNHKVFAIDLGDSVSAVKSCDILNADVVEFVEGPTQRTLPRYEFRDKLDAVLLDGPHAYPFPQLEYYFLYPHIREGGCLIIDDIYIPTVHDLFRFLREDDMFTLAGVVKNTAFFRRTSAPLFDPFSDNWYAQRYNRRRFPLGLRNKLELMLAKIVPEGIKRRIRAAAKP